MSKKAFVGDIFEIPTARGKAYAQCTHIHAEFGHLIRILPGFHEERPGKRDGIVKQKESFVAFLPLQAAVSRQIFEVVGHLEVPVSARKFPVFRAGVENPATKKVKNWWLWDGKKEWMAGWRRPSEVCESMK